MNWQDVGDRREDLWTGSDFVGFVTRNYIDGWTAYGAWTGRWTVLGDNLPLNEAKKLVVAAAAAERMGV
jgi:hypothetical protein